MTDDLGHDGAFAGYILVDARALLRLPDGVSARAAALAEPLAVALHGITLWGEIAEGDSVMVFGAGPIRAPSTAALLKTRVSGRWSSLSWPSHAATWRGPWVPDEASGLPSDLEASPFWEPDRISAEGGYVVLECSGKKAAMEAGFCQLRRGRRLVMVGAGIEPPTFDGNRMLLNELTVCGIWFVYDADGFDRAARDARLGRTPRSTR